MSRLLVLLSALVLLAVAGSLVFFTPGWIAQTGWQRVEVDASTGGTEPPASGGPLQGDLETEECRLDVERWDAGNRAEVERKYGQNAEAVVEGCRAIFEPMVD